MIQLPTAFKRLFRAFLHVVVPGGGLVAALSAQEPSAWVLNSSATVSGDGVFLQDLVTVPAGTALPHLRIADAPAFGTTQLINPVQLAAVIEEKLKVHTGTNWSGAAPVRVSRRARTLEEYEVIELLTGAITRDYLSQGGELELRMARAWHPVTIPDEPFEVKLVTMPAQGILNSFTVRFELGNDREVFGSWQASVRASLWKDVWVALHRMNRGDVITPADVGREKRDVLVARNFLIAEEHDLAASEWELTENVSHGNPLNRWSLRPKPVVYRGQMTDAVVRQGSLEINLRVQVLEDGVSGQNIRIRNPHTKRELTGKVNHDQTIFIQL